MIDSCGTFFFMLVFTIEQIGGFRASLYRNRKLGRPVAAHHITGIERRMAVRAFLPGFDDDSLSPPNDLSLHRVGTDRTIGQIDA